MPNKNYFSVSTHEEPVNLKWWEKCFYNIWNFLIKVNKKLKQYNMFVFYLILIIFFTGVLINPIPLFECTSISLLFISFVYQKEHWLLTFLFSLLLLIIFYNFVF